MKKQTFSVALGGIVAALSLVCLFLTGVFPFATYALPALAGVCLILIVIEIGERWAWLTYAVIALLALILTPDWEAKLLFVAFFGYYPILKARLERLRPRALEWGVKLVVFNTAVIAAYAVLLFVLRLDEVAAEFAGWIGPALLLGGNVVFVLYDISLTRLISTYMWRLRPKLPRNFH